MFSTSNGIEWSRTVKEVFNSSRNDNTMYRLPISQECYFSDDVWDLNEYNKIGDEERKYIYKYGNINYVYKDFVKQVILTKLVLEENRASTAHSELARIKKFINFLSKNYIYDVQMINKKLIISFFEENKWEYSTVQRYKSTITYFLDVVRKKNIDIDYDDVYKYLKDIDFAKIYNELEENKHKLIPFEMLNRIISLAIKYINNINSLIANNKKLTKEQLTDVMSCCMVVIIAETGMRIGEFHKLQIGKLKGIKIPSEEKTVHYLEFLTYKTAQEIDGHWTITYMTEAATLSYNTLLKVTKYKRKKSKYLYLSISDDKYRYISTLQKHFYRFFGIFQEELEFGRITNVDLEHFHCMEVTEKNKNEWYKGCLRNNEVGSHVYYATAHQFRVTVATILYKKGISIEFIRRHMNHLSEEMTMHYIRFSELQKEKGNIIEAILLRAQDDGLGLEIDKSKIESEDMKLELSVREYTEAYQNINKFLNKINKGTLKVRRLNVYNDVSEIIELFIAKNPITETELGFCVRDSFIYICKRQEFLNQINDTFYLSPYIHSIDNLGFNYNRYLEKVNIVKHNKSVLKINKAYINEYQRELKGLKLFAERRLLPEIMILKDLILKKGINNMVTNYKDLKEIILNIGKIEREVDTWMKKIS